MNLLQELDVVFVEFVLIIFLQCFLAEIMELNVTVIFSVIFQHGYFINCFFFYNVYQFIMIREKRPYLNDSLF